VSNTKVVSNRIRLLASDKILVFDRITC